ncbi:MAG: hypothetical protein GY856_36970 [bacterium]|nr:hypothetical protein [bacterium]
MTELTRRNIFALGGAIAAGAIKPQYREPPVPLPDNYEVWVEKQVIPSHWVLEGRSRPPCPRKTFEELKPILDRARWRVVSVTESADRLTLVVARKIGISWSAAVVVRNSLLSGNHPVFGGISSATIVYQPFVRIAGRHG